MIRRQAFGLLLAIFLGTVVRAQQPEAQEIEPFIAMLNSLVWSDRNKSSFALMQLTEGRDPHR